jgi:large subunit ribosomal protein L15
VGEIMDEQKNISLSRLKPSVGSKGKRKVLGRGQGTGHGGTSGKGHKGQNARSGSNRPAGFEGGQMPIQRRVPKRGFTNNAKELYQVLNLSDLAEFEGVVTPDVIKKSGLNKRGYKLKILGNGELTKALTIQASKFSKSAMQEIEKSGGKAVVI